MTKENKQGKVFRDAATQLEWAMTFAEAFPSIEDVTVDVDEEGDGNEGLGRRSFTRRSVREYLNCSNPMCTGKGYRLGDRLHQMSDDRQTEFAEKPLCEGRLETSGEPCPNRFTIQIRIQFK